MKKQLMYAALFMGALSSCSSDSEEATVQSTPEVEGREQIQLLVANGTKVTVNTRGTGMVGDSIEENNKWNNQKIHVIMTDAEDITIAQDELNGESYDLINDVVLTAPSKDAANDALYVTGDNSVDKQYYYYPTTGNFDFYGYHIDEDALGELTVDAENKKMTRAFTIDGSQDLMVAKAFFDGEYGDVKNAKELADATTNWAGRKYGAYAARRGVQPSLIFKHLLTKLNFIVKAVEEPEVLDETRTTAIHVDSIKVFSEATGTVVVVDPTVATVDELGVDAITWAGEEPVAFAVKQLPAADDLDRNLDDLETVTLEHANEEYPVGAGCLVKPSGAEGYKATIYISQYQKGDNLQLVPKQFDFEIKPTTKAGSGEQGVDAFYAGTAYNVVITTYGIQEILVSAQLDTWKDGGNIPVSPED